jgi:hypothetical protein
MKKINLNINNIRTVLGRITLETNCKNGRPFMVCIDNLVKGGIKQSLTLKNKTNRQYGKY